MKEGYKALGEFIRQIDIRNTEGKEDNLLGVSVQKQFIPSIANTVGTDFTKYKVVKKGQFTYIPDTSRRGDKIAIALLQDYEEGLVSNVYTVFEVIDEEKLLPEYLMPNANRRAQTSIKLRKVKRLSPRWKLSSETPTFSVRLPRTLSITMKPVSVKGRLLRERLSLCVPTDI